MSLKIRGVQAGEAGTVRVFLNGFAVGEAGKTGEAEFPIACGPAVGVCTGAAARPPEVALQRGDEGTWFVPEKAEMAAVFAGGRRVTVAEWTIGETAGGSPEDVRLSLRWSRALD